MGYFRQLTPEESASLPKLTPEELEHFRAQSRPREFLKDLRRETPWQEALDLLLEHRNLLNEWEQGFIDDLDANCRGFHTLSPNRWNCIVRALNKVRRWAQP
jgi:hypothetical protein